jgi:putative PIN family toxin of toxin-antitoxin system
MKVVLDTNVLVSALSSRSVYHWLINELFNEKFEVYITDEILLEYHEILEKKYSVTTANNFLAALQLLQTVHFTHIYFRWQLLQDADDNKFADCAIAANADYLITNDKDFNILKKVNFPKVSVVTILEFQKIIVK